MNQSKHGQVPKGDYTVPTFVIRERRPDELMLMVDINNRAMPPDSFLELEEAKVGETLHKPEEPPLRLLGFLDDEPVATGFAGRNIFTPKGRYIVGVQVVPEARGQGLAKQMYEQLTAFASSKQPRELTAFVRQDQLSLVESWLSSEGYEEIERMRPSELPLDSFDPSTWQESIDRVEQSGIQFTTLTAEDSHENRYMLWELSERLRQDVPHTGESAPFSFEAFQDLMNRPEARPDLLLIAKDGDTYIGYSLLIHQTPSRALTGMTGVEPAYRNRGIALALKAQSATLGKSAGYQVMRTYNHVNNPAMLAVNDRIGYVALPHAILFRKVL